MSHNSSACSADLKVLQVLLDLRLRAEPLVLYIRLNCLSLGLDIFELHAWLSLFNIGVLNITMTPCSEMAL